MQQSLLRLITLTIYAKAKELMQLQLAALAKHQNLIKLNGV
ncbi:hypothetical protein [Acinetobacter junii]|nr:hypothetical protein [Acinetobacter junii]